MINLNNISIGISYLSRSCSKVLRHYAILTPNILNPNNGVDAKTLIVSLASNVIPMVATKVLLAGIVTPEYMYCFMLSGSLPPTTTDKLKVAEVPPVLQTVRLEKTVAAVAV